MFNVVLGRGGGLGGHLANSCGSRVLCCNKLNVEKQLSDSSFDLNSDDVSERNLAVAEFDRLNQELIKIAKATNPREAGLAFGIRQMLLSTKNGLEIRRMELMKNKGGEKLTDAEMTFTREQWAKEKKLMQEQSELKEKKMQEDFDAALKLKEKEYQDLLAKRGAVEVSAAKAKSRQEVLKQKGKDLADKLRSNKQSGFYSDPFLVGKTLNFVLDTVADLVEAGADLASAIDKFVSDNRIQSRRKMVEDAIFDHLNRQDKRSKAIDTINEIAADTEAKTITKDNEVKDEVCKVVREKPIISKFSKGFMSNIMQSVTRKNKVVPLGGRRKKSKKGKSRKIKKYRKV
jgi:predicted transcriptional regulator